MKLHWLSLMSGVTLLALTGISHAASYNLDHDGSGDCGTFPSPNNGPSVGGSATCWSSEKTGQIHANVLGAPENYNDSNLPVTYEAYKVDALDAGGHEESGGYAAGFYEFAVTSDTGSGETVTISFTGGAGDAINCPTCYFSVKDGQHADPTAILVDLGGWDGEEQLVFTDIFTGQGTVSNFRILTTDVPLPAAAWLFGSGLIGLAGIAGKRRIA